MDTWDLIRRAFSSEAFAHGGVLALSAIALLIYAFASRRMERLPRIPTLLLLLYIWFRSIMKLLPAEIDPRIEIALDVAATIALYCAGVRILFSFTVEAWYTLRKKTKVTKITRDLVLFVSYAIVLLVVLRTKGGVNLVGLITTSAVLTAVIGLAAQNFLGNLFSGLAIQLEQPFRIGDWIEYGNYQGKVVSIGWEAVHIKTFDDELIIIPNLDLAKSVVKNHSRPTIRHAMKIDIGVEYGVTPHRVRQALLEVCREEALVLQDPAPVVRLLAYGDSAITYQIRFFYDGFGISPDLRAAMMNRIWYALRRHNIRIPFPIRDITLRHVERRFEESTAERLRAEALAQLNKVPILAPLSEEARASIAEHLQILDYGDGEIIVHQGDAGDSLYILHQGACGIEISAAGKPAERVATLYPPAFFGEMSLLTGEPRSATVRAISDTTVFSISKELVHEHLIEHPEIAESLALALAARQSDTAGFKDRKAEETVRQASTFLGKIKTFFGV